MHYILKILCLFLYCFHLSSTETNEDKIKRIFSEKFSKESHEIAFQKISGGLTNENYLLSANDQKFFVRFNLPKNELLGSCLKYECQASHLAFDAELAPQVFVCLPEEGIMIIEFIESNHEKINLKDSSTASEFCQLIKKLHSMEHKFLHTFCPFKCIDTYLANAHKIKAYLPDVFLTKILPQIKAYESFWKVDSLEVPCHLDLHHLNLINNGQRFYLIDWEYAAMADPFFDLATAASADYFSDSEMFLLLEKYLNHPPSFYEWKRFYLARILADTRWSIWSYLQNKISQIDASFEKLGERYLEEALERLDKIENFLLQSID